MTAPPRPALRWLAVVALGTYVSVTPRAEAPQPSAPATPSSSAPPLMVLLSVDQMRADYAQQYGASWTGGLRRLLDDGAVFTQAAYPYLATLTCTGHSTISTGTYPARHGMIQNTWWDRETASMVGCTADPTAATIGYMSAAPRGGHSLWRLRVPTLADQLRAHAAVPPKIVALSLKERSALTLAGRKADAVLWFDSRAGWVTSSAYTSRKVPFIEHFLATHPVGALRSQTWTRLLPDAAYPFPDDAEGEVPTNGFTRTFPHRLVDGPNTDEAVFFNRFMQSPFADQSLARLAVAAVEALDMGRGNGTDLLALSFSVLDIVGHDFGPRSQEVQDVLLHLDRTLGELFASLDRHVGRGRYVVALSADHGVAPIPEGLKALGRKAGRVDARGLRDTLQTTLSTMFGAGEHVARINFTDIYFAPGIADRLRANPTQLDRVKQIVRRWPGIDTVFDGDELEHSSARGDRRRRAAALSYFKGRSGDLVMVPRPYWIMRSEGTTHGSAADYDQRVPLILLGRGIQPGTYDTEATPADIAPTLAALSGVTLAPVDGRVLREALTPPSPAGPPSARGATTGKDASSSAPR